jgi:hypothetical protein
MEMDDLKCHQIKKEKKVKKYQVQLSRGMTDYKARIVAPPMAKTATAILPILKSKR